jgi:hypothetical protein
MLEKKGPAASGLVFFVRGSEGELKQCGMSSAPKSGTAAPDVSDSERVSNSEEEKRPEVMGEGSEQDVCCDGLQNNGGQLERWKCPHRGQASVPLDIVCYTAAGMCCMQAETRTRHGCGFQQGKAGQGRAGQAQEERAIGVAAAAAKMMMMMMMMMQMQGRRAAETVIE